MKHAIIGMGNLGLDLSQTLRSAGEDVECYKSIDLLRYNMDSTHFDRIWVTVGAGGPSKNPEIYARQLESHLLLPLEIMNRAHITTKVILFSTHYLNKDPMGHFSFYANTKRIMEENSADRENVVVYRIGSLYGNHFAEKTFPGKIAKKLLSGETFALPSNLITPTPTEWLSKKLIELEVIRKMKTEKHVILIAPDGAPSVYEWGVQIARDLGANPKQVVEMDADFNYPRDCSVAKQYAGTDSWMGLWEKYGFKLCLKIKRPSAH